MIDLATRFWGKVDATAGSEGCWPWRGCVRNGYGSLYVAPGETSSSNRVAWCLGRGPIPEGLCVCHTCDNRLCCNPAHLFLGTRAENNADRVAKGRSAHKLSDEAVALVRRLYGEGHSQQTLADMFGVSQTQISRIISGFRSGRAHSADRQRNSAV